MAVKLEKCGQNTMDGNSNIINEIYPLIEGINIERIRDISGPEYLARLGRKVFEFAEYQSSAELNIAHLNDVITKEPIVAWSRRSIVGKDHHFTMTGWSSDSYVLYDNMQPKEKINGVIQGYLFGNDNAVRGLTRAMPARTYTEKGEEPSRYELEELVNSYQNHPAMNPLFTRSSEVHTFCRIVRSLINQ